MYVLFCVFLYIWFKKKLGFFAVKFAKVVEVAVVSKLQNDLFVPSLQFSAVLGCVDILKTSVLTVNL